ncbi:hypothetical protein [Desulfobacula sp.]|uniref:hypothetical protein n=1 Tax=Desulfobacula sp. TaxID=2593537 RepID=UPI0026277E91|nr:hypothetical protein [Desulfobacula sp.]
MSAFKTAFEKIGKAAEDMASLEVVSYKGRITVTADKAHPINFATIIKGAAADAEFRITACTKSELDGDTQVFYDKEISQEEMDAHNGLVEAARSNRQAMVDLFKEGIKTAVGKISG